MKTKKPIRVLSVYGTRPEAVKMAPVVKALAQEPSIEAKICVTGQHRQMLDQVLKDFDIHPDYDLNLMKPDQSLTALTAQILTGIEPVFDEFKPDWVLVQGDTTTVMAASIAAFYHQIRVGHVEAGLRTENKWQPFPEEINRRIASVVADLHFAPTEHSRQNLLREGISDRHILVTGNPVMDALNLITSQPAPQQIKRMMHTYRIGEKGGRRLVLVTAHRRENFGDPLKRICFAIRTLAEKYSKDIQIIYPVHLNPHIQAPVFQMLSNVPNILLTPPMEYLPLIHLMKQATIVLTDSGGIQEEAPGLGIPTLVLREVTERPEGVDAGVLKLVGTDPAVIVNEASRLLDDPDAYQAMAKAVNPFGDGHAAARIVDAILGYQE
jgi:UDP-N-acetylglucosamine 2-epimerase (non-hydrolysing)